MRNHVLKTLSALAMCVLAPSADAAKVSVMPKPLQGIWMTDDGEGRVQCNAYKAAMQADNGDAHAQLVGAEVISGTMHHSYAEYGEGNFYQPRRIEKLGKNIWRINAAIGIDGSPEGQDSGLADYKLSLIGGKLKWDMDVDSWDEHVYFRCAAVPTGMYAS